VTRAGRPRTRPRACGLRATCLAILAAILLSGAPATGQPNLSAADLLEACTRSAANWVDFCNGFFQAAHDYGALLGEICAPADATRSDMVAIYTRYAPQFLDETPGVAEASGLVVAVSIIAAEYPCGGGES